MQEYFVKQHQSGQFQFGGGGLDLFPSTMGIPPYFQQSIAAEVANQLPSQPGLYGPPAQFGQLSGGICSYTHIPHYPHI